eukprot:scaffold93996_cov55-Attheya_sp.AAC.2
MDNIQEPIRRSFAVALGEGASEFVKDITLKIAESVLPCFAYPTSPRLDPPSSCRLEPKHKTHSPMKHQSPRVQGSACLVSTIASNSSGSHSITGTKANNPEWVNQDRFFVQNANGSDKNNRSVYLVFDGHGSCGHVVAQECIEMFPSILEKQEDNVFNAFELMHSHLLKSDINCKTSGTTCTAVVIKDKMLMVTNVGDSRALLARKQPNGRYLAFPMTVDHKPSTPLERERIERAGGRVGSRRGLSLPAKPNMSSVTDRVWFCTNGAKPTSVDSSVSMTGLAMSRSLGDEYAHNVGVSSEPHTFYSTLSCMDEFLILASDGISDVVGNDNAVFLVQEYIMSIPSNSDWDPNEAANIVAKEARNRWENAKASSIDDITCVVVKFRKKPLELATQRTKIL